MQKPDTAAIRKWMSTPVRALAKDGEHYCGFGDLQTACNKLAELCDYIDSLPEHCDHADKVRAEIREFVQELWNGPGPGEWERKRLREVLDFIDNGPKKPSAEEIIQLHQPTGESVGGFLGECSCGEAVDHVGDHVAEKLREAGFLKDPE